MPHTGIKIMYIRTVKEIHHTMTDQEMEIIADEFWEMVEKEAAEKEVTVDYYLAEFFFS